MPDTIETLSGAVWPALGPEATSVMVRGSAARRVPVTDLSPEDLRVLLSQRIDLDVVLPIAADRLAADPLMSGDYYPGDALEAALHLDSAVWSRYPAQRARLADALRALAGHEDVDAELVALIQGFLAAG